MLVPIFYAFDSHPKDFFMVDIVYFGPLNLKQLLTFLLLSSLPFEELIFKTSRYSGYELETSRVISYYLSY